MQTQPRQQWRELLISTREQLAQQPQWWTPVSQAIAAKLSALLAQRQPTCVGAYAPIRGEFDPLPLLAQWLSALTTHVSTDVETEATLSRQVGLPVMQKDKTLRYLRWTPDTPMRAGAKGILVPQSEAAITPDLLLLPCVGWGSNRVRLGYGGGWFDRTLAQWPSTKRPHLVGIGHKFGLLPELQAEPHDVIMDEIVTD